MAAALGNFFSLAPSPLAVSESGSACRERLATLTLSDL
jgi:hypothetical protein